MPVAVGANLTLIVQEAPGARFVVVLQFPPRGAAGLLKPVPVTATVKPPLNTGFKEGLVTVTVIVLVPVTIPNDTGVGCTVMGNRYVPKGGWFVPGVAGGVAVLDKDSGP